MTAAVDVAYTVLVCGFVSALVILATFGLLRFTQWWTNRGEDDPDDSALEWAVWDPNLQQGRHQQ